MSLSATSDTFHDELREAIRQEVYDKFYDVFGYLLPKEKYLELIEADIEALTAERESRIRNILRDETSLLVQPGTPEIPDISDYDLFGDLEWGVSHFQEEEGEENEDEKDKTALETISESCAESVLQDEQELQQEQQQQQQQ